MFNAGFTETSHVLRCYVLIGWPNDNFGWAEKRLAQAVKAGFFPMAMLWRDKSGKTEKEWRVFQRRWARPHIVGAMIKDLSRGVIPAIATPIFKAER